MVALLTGLQFKLTLRSLRGSTAKLVGMIVLGLYIAALFAGFIALSLFLRYESADVTAFVMVPLLALVALAWPVSMVLVGASNPLAPARFALFPVRARQMQPGLAVSALLTVWGILTLLGCVGFLIAWSGSLGSFAAALLGVVLGVTLSVVATRTLLAAMSAVFSSRRFRDLTAVALGVLLLAFVVGMQFLGQATEAEGLGVEWARIVPIIGWTPFGWAWSLPSDAAVGAWLAFTVKVAATLVSIGALWWVWGRMLDKALTTPFISAGATTKVRSTNAVERLFPTSPAGAIGARTMRLWLRDPRRLVQGLSMAILPVVFTLQLRNDSAPSELYLLIPVATVAFGVMGLAFVELNFDGSALSTQIVTGASGRADRWGRLMGLAWFLVPLALLLTLGYVAATGLWGWLVTALAATLGTLGVSAGVGLFVGSMWNYSVPPSGAGLNTRGNFGAFVGMLLAMIAQSILLLPVVGLAVWSYWSQTVGLISPFVSLAMGALVAWLGVVLGGAQLDRSWPEVLKRITWAD